MKCTLLPQYDNGRLVDHHGIINENAFYQYFTVWYNHEFISVAATQGNFRPTPPAWTSGGKSERKVDSKSGLSDYSVPLSYAAALTLHFVKVIKYQ